MSIGIYDEDFFNYSHVIPSLSLMKLSAYYKQRRELVVLVPNAEPARHTKFIVHKDYDDGEFNSALIRETNVSFNGRYFNGGQYKSLGEEIENYKPDKFLYARQASYFNDPDHATRDAAIYRTIMRATHLRLSLNGKDIYSDVYKSLDLKPTTHNLLFHDYDLGGVEGVLDFVKDLNMHKPGDNKLYIGTKYPIQTNNWDELHKWIKQDLCQDMFLIQYNGIMEDAEMYEYIKESCGAFPYKFYYNIASAPSGADEFLEHDLPKIYRQALLLRTNERKILLKCDDEIFIDKRLSRLMKLINLYINMRRERPIRGLRNYDNDFTLYRFITNGRVNFFENPRYGFSRQEVTDLFMWMRERSYETFKMFYEWTKVDFIGGEIKCR